MNQRKSEAKSRSAAAPSSRGTAAPVVEITKRLEFSASHRLFNPEFSEERNWEIYGICNNPNGHGHNYALDVTVAGAPDPRTGMIIDLKQLKDLLDEILIRKVDHKNLNLDVPFLRGCVPTVEMLVLRFWEQLEGKLPGCRLHELVLYESRTNYARYRGAGAGRHE
jgi:6-pyruvoyltetrahydropterin/6-carboxytetrahydropterin synthase